MSETSPDVCSSMWRSCPCLNIVRTFRMAIHPVKLALVLVALLASAWIAVALDQGFETDVAAIGAAEMGTPDGRISVYENLHHIATNTLWTGWEIPWVTGTFEQFLVFLFAPLTALVQVMGLVYSYWAEAPIFALITTVTTLAVWAWIGGAVCRMAAVRFAREENVPVKAALGFSCKKWPSLATCLLIPFGVLVLLAALVGAPTGLVAMIPVVGEILIPIVFFLTLLLGFVLALIFVGGVFSIPLQWPTIAAEGSDSFDAISRSVAYISGRPWRYLGYTVFSLVYGCLAFIFVKFVAVLTLKITHIAVSTFTWGGEGSADKLVRLWEAPTWSDPFPGAIQATGTEAFGEALIAVWVWAVLGFAVAYLFSFLFTSQTIIYFLLRREVDATDIEEVYLEEPEEGALPLEYQAEEPTAGTETEEDAAPPVPPTEPSPEPPAADEAEETPKEEAAEESPEEKPAEEGGEEEQGGEEEKPAE